MIWMRDAVTWSGWGSQRFDVLEFGLRSTRIGFFTHVKTVISFTTDFDLHNWCTAEGSTICWNQQAAHNSELLHPRLPFHRLASCSNAMRNRLDTQWPHGKGEVFKIWIPSASKQICSDFLDQAEKDGSTLQDWQIRLISLGELVADPYTAGVWSLSSGTKCLCKDISVRSRHGKTHWGQKENRGCIHTR